MNARQIILLIVAAVAALGVALLVRGMIGGEKPRAAERSVLPAVSLVLVASRDIAMGEPVSDAMVSWQSWPRANVDGAFVSSDGRTPISKIVAGSVARVPLVKGEPITFTKIAKNGTPGGGILAATLSAGMRAVSIPVSTATVVGGFVQPGNRVDVLQTTNSGGKVEATIILSNLRLLAVDQTFDAAASKVGAEIRTVTLEMTPGQTKILAQKQASGSLSLALRPLADNDNGAPITIVRGSAGPADNGR